MNCYQKFYTNQIHSSSLLCQLATMWKSQILCDAIIRSGSVITKAHRVVLVAACPMLQSMENAAVGSHLEVRLASDIKQGSINTFLQYLYEGFMMLTEENCKDVEKIARLLQVDSVIKCCADFYKCLGSKTGNSELSDQYKYTFHDMVEFRHVRSSDLQKMQQDRMMKRGLDLNRPSSPGGKRQRIHRPLSPVSEPTTDDAVSMSNSYNNSYPEPWERIPRLGMPSRQNVAPKPGVIDIVEDSLELIQTEPPDANSSISRNTDKRPSQKSVSIAVSSQIKSNTDLQIVNVSDSNTRPRPPDPRTSMNLSQSSVPANPLTLLSEMSSAALTSTASVSKQTPERSQQPPFSSALQKNNQTDLSHLEVSTSSPTVSVPRSSDVYPIPTSHQSASSSSSSSHVSRSPVTSLPFAAGSMAQSSSHHQSAGTPKVQSEGSMSKNDNVEKPSDTSQDMGTEKLSSRPSSSADKAPDISIVKIESDDENTGLDMYVDMPDEGEMRIIKRSEHGEVSDSEHDQTVDWMREEMSNEGSMVNAGDQSTWYMGQPQFKDLSFDVRGGPYVQVQQSVNCHVGSGDTKGGHGSKQASNLPVPYQLENTSYSLIQEQLVSMLKNIDVSIPHSLIRLGGKQKSCILCKYMRRKTGTATSVRTYYKCSVCDVPLCKGDRNCFMALHECLKNQRFPELQWQDY